MPPLKRKSLDKQPVTLALAALIAVYFFLTVAT